MKNWKNCYIPEVSLAGAGWRRLPLVLAGLLLAAGLPAAGQTDARKSGPAREQSEAYVLLIKADKARDGGKMEEARQGYESALAIYRSIAASSPDWQPDIVQYRLTYCANQIEAIRSRINRPVAVEQADEPVGRGPSRAETDTQDKYQVLQKENQYLHQRISQLQEELESAEKKPVTVSEQTTSLKAESEALRREIADLKGRGTAVTAGTVDADYHRQIVLENDSLKAQLAAAQRDVRASEQDAEKYRKEAALAATLKEQVQSLQQQVKSLSADQKSQAGRADALAADKARLEKSLQEKTAEAAAAGQSVKELTAGKEATGKELARAQADAEKARQELARVAADKAAQEKQLNEELRQAGKWKEQAEQDALAIRKLQSEVKDLQAQRDARARQVESLQKQVSGSTWNQQEFDALKKDLEVRAREVQSLEKQLAASEYLRQENKELKDNLARLRQGGPAAAAPKPDASAAELAALRAELQKRDAELAALKQKPEPSRKSDSRPAPEPAPAPAKPRRRAEAPPAAPPPPPPAAEKPAAEKPAVVAPASAPSLRSALALERKGSFSDAAAEYEQLRIAEPGSLEAVKGVGRCRLKLGETGPAIAALESVAPAQRDADLLLLLGTAYCADQRFEPAVDVLRRVVDQDPRNANAFNALGAAWMGLGSLDQARQALESAVQINPRLSDAHFNLAQVYCFNSPPDLPQARRHYDEAIQLGAAPNPDLEKVLQGK